MLFASTMRTFRSQWQKERNIPDQSNDFLRQMMDLTLWKLDTEVVRRGVLGTGQFFDWYSEKELPEIIAAYDPRPYVFDIPVNGQVGPQYGGFHNGSGKAIMKTMLRECERLGVDIYLEHRAVDAEVTDGRITAILAETPQGTACFSCCSVILSCGCWIANREIVDKVLPAFYQCDLLPSAHLNPVYTGDGLPIAEKAGAVIDWENFCLRIMAPICGMGDHSKFDVLTKAEDAVLVDLNGKRFVAEPMAPRIDPFATGHVMLKHPKGKAFFLYSANIFKKMIEDTRKNVDYDPEHDTFGMPVLPDYEELDGWFVDALAKGKKELARGDTIEELAQQIGVDPTALKNTVDEYNASCAGGVDWRFYKDPAHLVPLTEGPFYALSGKLSTDGAFGGPRVNRNMQAVHEDGSPVEGLYVTGDFASGKHISLGGLKCQALNDMSWALSSGYIAGSSVGEYLT